MISTGDWVDVRDEKELERAVKLARGDYQDSILRGYEALSGSTLTGKAKQYGGKYYQSRQKIIQRCIEAGIKVGERTGEHGKRILVIG